MMESIDRRTFLGAIPLTAAALGCGGGGAEAGADVSEDDAPAGGADRAALLPAVGVQLYTLRDAITEDLDAVLASLVEIGYAEVELFQLHGLTPGEMRTRLDAAGLRAASSHYGLGALREGLARHVEGALEIGQELMVVPSIDGAERSPDGLARVAEDFNRIAETVREAGMRFGYHNHDWEFRPFDDGTVPMEMLLDRTDPALVDWQMDIFWTVHGGADPLEALEARSGRVTSVHVKDRTVDGQMVDVGDGVIDFAEVLSAARGHGLRHAFVEHDAPGDAVQSVRRSYEHLSSIGVVS